ncbi:S-adenosylmethionine:tRNA ribosyltransferase-isomerase [soil metagenome]
MTVTTPRVVGLPDELPPELIAAEPVEATGRRRDDVRLLVAERSSDLLVHTTFRHLPEHLQAGDLLVVNTSGTLPAALPADGDRLLHLSTGLPGGLWVVEVRRRCGLGSLQFRSAQAGEVIVLPDGGRAELLTPYPADARHADGVRLWTARLTLPEPVTAYLHRVGRPIRYGCAETAWPLAAYQTVFSLEPGSAEMPSAARGFTAELVTALVSRGVGLSPVTLHTGVSSQEAGEPPYAEWFRVPEGTAERVNAAHAGGHRVIAVGTTVTRALETTVDGRGAVHPAEGWTDRVVTPSTGVRAIDGLLTGWHEPAATHLDLLEAVAGRRTVERSYAAAVTAGYRWHEFGDLHLVLP